MTNVTRMWLPALIAMLVMSVLVAACGNSAPASPAAPGERPTMLYFYTDN